MIIRHGFWWDRFWGMIPKVLPTVYDDSLSYYEVLNKLIKATGELAGAVDDVVAEAAQYTEDAQQAATSAEQSAQAAASAASTFQITEWDADNMTPLDDLTVHEGSRLMVVGTLVTGTISVHLGDSFSGDELVGNLPLAKDNLIKILALNASDGNTVSLYIRNDNEMPEYSQRGLLLISEGEIVSAGDDLIIYVHYEADFS